MVFFRPQSTEDEFRIKGSGINLLVFRDDNGTSARLRGGASIHPGDRLGFQVRNRDDGYLLVMGIDGSGEPYLCYPQSEGGSAMPTLASPSATTLPEAIEVDDVLGEDHLIAVICDEPFHFDDIAGAIQTDELPHGCAVDEVLLQKH